MKQFMDRDFLLDTDTARHLFHDYAEKLPLVDYHCHISPKEIYEDRRFNDLAEIWLGGENEDGTFSGDHYKWRLMRANGIDEKFVTGAEDGRERIKCFAQTLEMAIGNPMYHWTNLELHRFFGEERALTEDNAGEIYEKCSQRLREDPYMSARGLIVQSNVRFIGTTDDPLDSLEWHKKLAEDESFGVSVCPSFRPDKAINISKPGFPDYISKLAVLTGRASIRTTGELIEALSERLAYFVSVGCRASDHGLDYVPYRECSEDEADNAFRKAMAEEPLSLDETEKFQTYMLIKLGREYHRLGIVMQLHYSCMRNVNEKMYRTLGANAGFDIIAQNSSGENIARLLSVLDMSGECPKTILYSLNPADNQQIDTIAGCFQSSGMPGKIQHGSAWWFNDTKSGMEEHMKSLANLGLLGSFVGMLTDSRSFLSYVRHDYFRRILCNIIGHWVENGEYPNNEATLKKIVEGVCYYNAVKFFNL